MAMVWSVPTSLEHEDGAFPNHCHHRQYHHDLQVSVNCIAKLAKRESYREKPFSPITGCVGQNHAQKVSLSRYCKNIEDFLKKEIVFHWSPSLYYILIIIEVTALPHIPNVEWARTR